MTMDSILKEILALKSMNSAISTIRTMVNVSLANSLINIIRSVENVFQFKAIALDSLDHSSKMEDAKKSLKPAKILIVAMENVLVVTVP